MEEKRPDLLIRSLEVVNRKYPNARIVFAGEYQIKYEGTWQRHSELVAQYRRQLIFLGLITDSHELANFYAACDVLALPSDSDCFALVQAEAMLCGSPVVSTDIPGARVAVSETGMGKLAPRGDWRAFGETLLDVLEHRSKYVRSRDEIAAVFCFEETVNRYEAMFYQYSKD